jgi:hypothetical protein
MLGVDISPFTETLNLLCERKEPISLIKLVENSNLDSLYSHVVSKALFNVQEHSVSGHFIVEIKGNVIR